MKRYLVFLCVFTINSAFGQVRGWVGEEIVGHLPAHLRVDAIELRTKLVKCAYTLGEKLHARRAGLPPNHVAAIEWLNHQDRMHRPVLGQILDLSSAKSVSPILSLIDDICSRYVLRINLGSIHATYHQPVSPPKLTDHYFEEINIAFEMDASNNLILKYIKGILFYHGFKTSNRNNKGSYSQSHIQNIQAGLEDIFLAAEGDFPYAWNFLYLLPNKNIETLQRGPQPF